MDNTVKTAESEKPDFEHIYITKCAQSTASNVWDKYVSPLLKENQSLKDRVKELEQEKKGVDAEYDSLVDLVSDYFMGGSGDTTTLYEVEKFLRAHFKPMLSRIKSLESENEELRKKGQWISVKERLPLTDEYVLITDGNEVWVGNYERSGYKGRSQWGQAYIGCSMVDDTKVTHWQPLPSKPENK